LHRLSARSVDAIAIMPFDQSAADIGLPLRPGSARRGQPIGTFSIPAGRHASSYG